MALPSLVFVAPGEAFFAEFEGVGFDEAHVRVPIQMLEIVDDVFGPIKGALHVEIGPHLQDEQCEAVRVGVQFMLGFGRPTVERFTDRADGQQAALEGRVDGFPVREPMDRL
jgi:hypothetical protein